MTSERVHEILGWYASDNPGTRTNLSRLLNHEALSSRMIERIVGEAHPPPWLDGERR